MRVFNQAKASAVVTQRLGVSILTFCSIICRIDYGSVRESVRNRGLYGCWQCGEDMLQGLLLDKPMDDDNAWRRGRQER